MAMSKTFAQLNTNVWPFLKGTQFEIISEDDGMYSLCDFFRGPTSDGQEVTCQWKECDIIPYSQYKGIVIKDPWVPYEREEQDWEYTNYP